MWRYRKIYTLNKKPQLLPGFRYSNIWGLNYFLSNIFISKITANKPTKPELPRVFIKPVTLPTTSIPNTAPPKSTCTKIPTERKVIIKSLTLVKKPLIDLKMLSIVYSFKIQL